MELHAIGSTLDADNQWFRLEGNMAIESLDIEGKSEFSVNGISGNIPFQLDLDQKERKLLVDRGYRPLSWIEYENQRSVGPPFSRAFENFKIKKINADQYTVSNIICDIDIRKGFIQIPWFNVQLFDGSVGGSIQVQLGSGMKEDISYKLQAHASRINSAALGDFGLDKQEETELNAAMAFEGRGIQFQKEINLDGYFHITQIGPRFASILLRGMDPEGSDRSIRMTRYLLDRGWKPKLFSFELRHGYVYPSLMLSQPWFSPIRIPGRLEYGRLPLVFFLKMSKQKP